MFKGNVEMVQAFADVGLLGLEPVAALQNGQAPVKWRALTAQLLNCGAGEGCVWDDALAAQGMVLI